MSETNDTNGLKIICLQAENFERIKAISITPTGELVQITGRNKQGKTAVLNSIAAALGGAKSRPTMPLRRGTERGFVKVSLGGKRVELIVDYTFTASGAALTVSSPEGYRVPSPQAMLSALYGELTFDPERFANADPREQFEMLRGIVKLDVDLGELDGLNKRDYDARTLVNRDAKSARANADAIEISDGALLALIDTAALKSRMTEASETNVGIEKRRGKRETATREIENLRTRATAERTEAQDLRARADRMDAGAKHLEDQADETARKLAEAPALPEPVNIDSLRSDLDRAEAHNRAVTQETERRERKAALVAEVNRLETQSRSITETMAGRDTAKANAIARAPMPVPGLGFGDGIVTFDGVPFAQASGAEQIRVSLAVAMALNPRLKVIRINEGSALDPENLALIHAIAREHDYQVWVHRVDTTGKVGIVIEDGSVVAVDGEPVGASAKGESA